MTTPSWTAEQIEAAADDIVRDKRIFDFAWGESIEGLRLVIIERLRTLTAAGSPTAPTAEQIEAAVDAVLKENKWPILETYDDAGLTRNSYVEFVGEVITVLTAAGSPPTPTIPGDDLLTKHQAAIDAADKELLDRVRAYVDKHVPNPLHTAAVGAMKALERMVKAAEEAARRTGISDDAYPGTPMHAARAALLSLRSAVAASPPAPAVPEGCSPISDDAINEIVEAATSAFREKLLKSAGRSPSPPQAAQMEWRPPNGWQDAAVRLLAIRDALVKEDHHEAYHELRMIVDPGATIAWNNNSNHWIELEKIVAAPSSPSTPGESR